MFVLVGFGHEASSDRGLAPVHQITFGAEVSVDVVKLLRSEGVSLNRIVDGEQLDPGPARTLCEYIVQSAEQKRHIMNTVSQAGSEGMRTSNGGRKLGGCQQKGFRSYNSGGGQGLTLAGSKFMTNATDANNDGYNQLRSPKVRRENYC